jgi:uncharacterized membrane protein YbhN (UPF0104 family)
MAPGLRAVATTLMLVVLLRRVHLSSLLPSTEPATFLRLVAAIAVMVVAIALSAVRWQRVLVALEAAARLRTLLSHTFAGMFVSNFLPSTIGGDVLRVSRLSAANGQAPTSFASVVLERMTGWIVLPVITLTGLALNPHLRHLGTASKVAIALSGVTLLLLGAVLAAASSRRIGGRLAGHENWLRFVGAIHLGTRRFREHPFAALEVLGAAFVYQLAIVFVAFLAGTALELHVGWTAMMAFVPMVAVVQVLPVTIGGLGVREGAFVLFLHPLGVATHAAISLLFYGVTVVASLVGAPAFALGRPVDGSVLA